MEFLFVIVMVFIAPVLVEMGIKRGHARWLEPWLREAWAILFCFLTVYLVSHDKILAATAMLHGYWKTRPIIGYVVLGCIGALIFCGYWWFTGRFSSPSENGAVAGSLGPKTAPPEGGKEAPTSEASKIEHPPIPKAKHPPTNASLETLEQQRAFLRQLTQLYISGHDNISSEMLSGLELPPDDWLNKELQKYGKSWRVKNGHIVERLPEQNQQQPVIIQTAPTFGNLKQRATALSQEITQDLWMHGWSPPAGQQLPPGFVIQPMPKGGREEITQWTRSRSSYFRWKFFDRVLDMRNEFAQLHIRDQRLDDFFKYQGMIEQANRQLAAAQPQRQIDSLVLPQEIEMVAERLKVLAEQLKSP